MAASFGIRTRPLDQTPAKLSRDSAMLDARQHPPYRHARPQAYTRRPVITTPMVLVVAIAMFAVLTLIASLTRLPSARTVGGPIRNLRNTVNGDVDVATTRKLAVRDAMEFVWTNYHTHAFGADEITPLDGKPNNNWGNIGCMILDSMDTLWVMDLKEEFEQARVWVRDELSFENMGVVSVFETIIRALGGLLSTYDLSKDQIFLSKAQELADRMMPAIDETTGRANYFIDTLTNGSFHPGGLAESGSYQLEFEYLSHATGDPKYATVARKLYPYLQNQSLIQREGLFANEIYAVDGNPATSPLTLTLGGGGDSFYEYVLKVWIFQGQPEPSLIKDMFLASTKGMERLLLGMSTSGHLFVGERGLTTDVLVTKLEHLTCFVPGWLTLGANRIRQEDPERSARLLLIATQLMETCYKDLYEKQPTKLAPEYVEGPNLEAPSHGAWAAISILRPEVVESLYVMHQLTGDPKYQEWGWQIFQAIDRHCRTQFGFAQFKDVTAAIEWSDNQETRQRQAERVLNNRMETFFAAETLKYLYLLFDLNNTHVSLDTHVFNTEAHPMPIMS